LIKFAIEHLTSDWMICVVKSFTFSSYFCP